MSCDFAVWSATPRMSHAEASERYAGLCAGEVVAEPDAAVAAFHAELTTLYPDIDTIPADDQEAFERCPWSCALDVSPGHVVMSCTWSRADDVEALVQTLAAKHGLAFFDPQADRVAYPASGSAALPRHTRADTPRPWWKFW